MKAHRKQVVGVLAIALITCFYILAVHAMQSLEEEMQFVSFVQTTEGGIPVQEYQEENQTLWSEFIGMSVENRELFRKVDTTVWALHGRSDLLFPQTPMINVQSQTNCLLSTSLAYELFGTTDVAGLSVIYQEKEYEIAGVIEHKENLFVYEPKEGETATFQRVVTKVKEDESMRVLEETLQMKFGSGKVLDYTWLKMILDLYLLMIPVLLSIFLLRTIWTYQKESKNKSEKCIWMILFGIMGVIIGFLILQNIHVPLDMIPERWSDFEFWADCVDYQRENLERLIQMRKTVFDMRGVTAVRQIVCYNTVAILLFYGNPFTLLFYFGKVLTRNV